MKTIRESLEDQLDLMKGVLLAYPDMFHGKILDENLLINIYAHVYTRCHGVGSDNIIIAPMADNLNHNIGTVGFECMNMGF